MIKAALFASLIVFVAGHVTSEEGRKEEPESKCDISKARNNIFVSGEYAGIQSDCIHKEKIYRAFLVDNWEYVDQGIRDDHKNYTYHTMACNALSKRKEIDSSIMENGYYRTINEYCTGVK